MSVLALGTAFFLGSLPFGWILVRLLAGRDVRTVGSGNIGATNALRAGGWGIGVATLLLDAAKGWLGFFLGVRLLPADSGPWWQAGLMLAAPLGHAFTPWLRFRGGKAVATALGVLGAADVRLLASALAGFALGVLPTRRASAGSISCALCAALAGWLLPIGPGMAWGSALIALLILLRHLPNIRRLWQGTEPRLGQKPA